MNPFVRLLTDDDGATMAEYALVVSLVAVVCIIAVHAVGLNTSALYQNLANSM